MNNFTMLAIEYLQQNVASFIVGVLCCHFVYKHLLTEKHGDIEVIKLFGEGDEWINRFRNMRAISQNQRV